VSSRIFPLKHVDAKCVIFGTRHAIAQLRSAGGKSAMNLSSTAGLIGVGGSWTAR
jgi:hypothetical protein